MRTHGNDNQCRSRVKCPKSVVSALGHGCFISAENLESHVTPWDRIDPTVSRPVSDLAAESLESLTCSWSGGLAVCGSFPHSGLEARPLCLAVPLGTGCWCVLRHRALGRASCR